MLSACALRCDPSSTIFPRSAPRKTATFVSFCCYRKIMERGSSVPWQDTLREAIGDDKLDASALREYFRPLEDWLRTENLRTGDIVGWSYGKKLTCRCSALYPRYRLFVSDTFVLSLIDYFKRQIEQLRFTWTNLIPNIYLWNPNFYLRPFTWHGQSTTTIRIPWDAFIFPRLLHQPTLSPIYFDPPFAHHNRHTSQRRIV